MGPALIQLAKRRGVTVIGLASEAKHTAMTGPGADALLPRAPDDLGAALQGAIGQATVTVVADIMGGPHFAPVIDVLARGGRYTCSGAIAGPMVDLDLRTFYLRDLTFTGSTVIPPHIFRDLVGDIKAGDMRPLLAASYPLAELHAAQRAFMDKRHVGNIVATP